MVHVHAANLSDTKEGCVLADLSFKKIPEVRGVRVDKGYRGTFVRTVREKWRREAHISAREGKGFVIEPKRWVVERTFGWFDGQRRLGKDHEKLTCVSGAMTYLAAIARPFKNHIFN